MSSSTPLDDSWLVSPAASCFFIIFHSCSLAAHSPCSWMYLLCVNCNCSSFSCSSLFAFRLLLPCSLCSFCKRSCHSLTSSSSSITISAVLVLAAAALWDVRIVESRKCFLRSALNNCRSNSKHSSWSESFFRVVAIWCQAIQMLHVGSPMTPLVALVVVDEPWWWGQHGKEWDDETDILEKWHAFTEC